MIVTIIDIETTGLSRYTDDVLEFAFIRIESSDLSIVSSGVLYFYKPEFNIENPTAQRVHGLTREYLKQYETDFDANLAQVYAIMQNGAIVGKNSDSFDVPFMQSWIGRMAPVLPDVRINSTLDMQTFFADIWRNYCKADGIFTRSSGKLTDYMRMFGLSESDVKTAFVKEFGEERAQAHAALYDTYMTYLCLVAAVKSYGLELN